MPDNLSWSSGTGFLVATTESGVGAGITAHFQKVIVQTGLIAVDGLVGVTGQVTAQVGTVTAEVKGTLTAQVGTITAQVANVITAESRGFVTAQVTGGWPIGVTGQVTAQVGTVTAEVKGTVTAQVGVITAQGPIAVGASAAGNPLFLGLQGFTSQPAAQAHLDIVPMAGDQFGRPMMRNWPSVKQMIATGLAVMAGINTVTAITAQAAGVGIMISKITVSNSHGTTGVLVSFKNGTNTIEQVWCAPSGGGAVIPYPVPMPISAASACVVTTDASADVYVSILGWTETL